MTKREFYAKRAVNYGCRMASDTREHYRDDLGRSQHKHKQDQLARKAAMGPGALLEPSALRTGLSWRLLGRVIHGSKKAQAR